MPSNFAFLREKFPVLANFGGLAEQYCYTDANSCLIKLGMIGETIVNLIFTYDHIDAPCDDNAAEKINMLYRMELIDKDLCDILHSLRKNRNKAAHENYSSTSTAKILLGMAYSLCEWFMQTYGDWTYEHHDYIPPSVQTNQETAAPKKQEEKKQEETLVKEAEAKAKETPRIPLETRKNQSRKAARQRPKTEEETRFLIDDQLRQVGWEADTANLRYSKGTRPAKGRNIAIAEWPTNSKAGNSGHVDYALFVGLKLVAVVEAKAIHKNVSAVLDYQGKDYPRNIRSEDTKYIVGKWGEYKVPFTFATNGRPYLEQLKTLSGIWFQDLRRPDNAPKALRGWYSPDRMMDMLQKDIEASDKKLKETPYDLMRDKDGLNLRSYQIEAIEKTEEAIMHGKREILIAMATGTGKTRTVLGMIYRFLKTQRFNRILFLVDRNALGDQALDVFREVKLEELLTLDEIYNVKGLDDKTAGESGSLIHVSTVQGLIKRILYNSGEEMPSVGDYDLIIVDEAHRGYILDKDMTEDELLYRSQLDYQSKYRAVIDYFDAVKIGLTATPALHTKEIFGEPVYKYTYRQAVIEGYLVDHDAPHKLTTKLTQEGIHYTKGDTVTIYDPATGEITNSELLEDELNFDVEHFNKQIVVENYNRAVLEEISRDIDPEAQEQGKTLIYAVNNEHADLIVKILKEIYAKTGVDNSAIMKITANAGSPKLVKEAIKKFKNERFPSIVVTVDLLTTGIDVASITTLVFMRCVKSRILFEQMLGRATRLCPEIHKTHFEIYDPIGIYDALQDVNTMKPVVANPSATFDDLLEGLRVIEEPKQISAQIDQIIAKLQRKSRNMTQNAQEQFKQMAGQAPEGFIRDIENRPPTEAKRRILELHELFNMLQNERAELRRPIVISDKEDTLISHERGYGNNVRPEDYIESFAQYVRDNINKIAALNIVCTRPKDLTRQELVSLRMQLDREGYTTQQLNTAVSELTNEKITADIISLIRRYALGSDLISHEEKIRRAVSKLRHNHKFTKQEENWLRKIETYLLNESIFNKDTFDEDWRFRDEGGFKRINKIFGDKLDEIIIELNEYLYEDGGQTA